MGDGHSQPHEDRYAVGPSECRGVPHIATTPKKRGRESEGGVERWRGREQREQPFPRFMLRKSPVPEAALELIPPETVQFELLLLRGPPSRHHPCCCTGCSDMRSEDLDPARSRGHREGVGAGNMEVLSLTGGQWDVGAEVHVAVYDGVLASELGWPQPRAAAQRGRRPRVPRKSHWG